MHNWYVWRKVFKNCYVLRMYSLQRRWCVQLSAPKTLGTIRSTFTKHCYWGHYAQTVVHHIWVWYYSFTQGVPIKFSFWHLNYVAFLQDGDGFRIVGTLPSFWLFISIRIFVKISGQLDLNGSLIFHKLDTVTLWPRVITGKVPIMVLKLSRAVWV